MNESSHTATINRVASFAISLATQAGKILTHQFDEPLDVEYKDSKNLDPVTSVDKNCQKFLNESIQKQFPDHSILGEEDDDDDRVAHDFVWVIDPLDGTKNYLNGVPTYACSIGVLYRGVPIAGSIFLPWPCSNGGIVLHACRDKGAFIGNNLLSKTTHKSRELSSLVGMPGFYANNRALAKRILSTSDDIRVTGSIAYEFAMTAKGVFKCSYIPAPRLWDVVAGTLLVREAGGATMIGHKSRLKWPFLNSTQWGPIEALVPEWDKRETTLKELRQWSKPMVVGEFEAVKYITVKLGERSSF